MSTLYVTTLCEHPNSDEFRPAPVRHLDLDTPAFYYYRKNPSVTTLSGESCKTPKSTSSRAGC